jgi:hypothetical protein
MTASSTSTTRTRAHRVAVTVEIDDEIVQPPGLSYVCRDCDVYGYLSVGERRACWCCGTHDRLARR